MSTGPNSTEQTPENQRPAAQTPRRLPPDRPETPSERRLVNMIIIGFIVFVLGAALWLGDALLETRRMDDCLASGRRNCAPITVPAPPVR